MLDRKIAEKLEVKISDLLKSIEREMGVLDLEKSDQEYKHNRLEKIYRNLDNAHSDIIRL